MKKIINDVAAVEDEMIRGLVQSAPQRLRKLECGNVVVRAAFPEILAHRSVGTADRSGNSCGRTGAAAQEK